MPRFDETSPGTDWLARVVGSKFAIERSIDEILEIIRSVSLEIYGTDVVRMEFEGIDPAILNIRMCTGDMTKLGTRKVDLLNFGEKEGLAILVNPLSIYKRPKGLVCFDLDSTLVNEELIVEVAKVAGVEDEVEKITEQAMSGEIEYSQSFMHRVALLRGVREEDMEEIWRSTKTAGEVNQLLTTLRMMGIKTAILSGAFTFFTHRARDRLGTDFVIGNDVVIEEGRIAGSVRGKIVTGKVKLERMRDFAAELELPLEDVVAVGDGANDLEIIREAGTGIAYDKGGLVISYADAVLPHGHLGDLLFLIGS
jgi:phosphoserine phosphatase